VLSDGTYSDFLEACGADGPLVLRYECSKGGSEVELARPFAIAGRTPDADIVIDGPGVGGRYAFFQLIGGRLLCIDLRPGHAGSRPGRPRRAWLRPGQSLRLADGRIRWVSGAGRGPAPRREALPTVFVEGPSSQSWRFRRPITLIGSSDACAIRLAGPRVSRFHAAFVAVEGGVWLVNLILSATGTPAAVRCPPRVLLRIGDHQLHTRIATPVRRSSSAIQKATAVATPAPVAGGDAMAQYLLRMHEDMFTQFQQTVTLFVTALTQLQQDQAALIAREMDRVDLMGRELAEIRAVLSGQRPQLPAAAAATPASTSPPRQAPKPMNADAPVGHTPENLHAWLSQRVTELQAQQQTMWSRIRGYMTNASQAAANPGDSAKSQTP